MKCLHAPRVLPRPDPGRCPGPHGRGLALQKRKGTDIPYLTHLLVAMPLVGEHGGSEEQTIASLLLDTLEDIERITREDLERLFGGRGPK